MSSLGRTRPHAKGTLDVREQETGCPGSGRWPATPLPAPLGRPRPAPAFLHPSGHIGQPRGVGGARTPAGRDRGPERGSPGTPRPPPWAGASGAPGRQDAGLGRGGAEGGGRRGAGPGGLHVAAAAPGPPLCSELLSRRRSRSPGQADARAGGPAMGSLWMALLCALAGLGPGTRGGCVDEGRCCPGRDPTCFVEGWRLDRVFGKCFCDQECHLLGDCCFDYDRACPARPCVVGEWSPWSACAHRCRPSVRVRRRAVHREPQHGGEPCPPLEERTSCLEYSSPQGQECGHLFVPALITTSAFNKERMRKLPSPNWSSQKEAPGYCMEFRTESYTPHCTMENRPLTRWMQYIREGYTVCVDCQHPAMNAVSHRCSGDGLDSDGSQTLYWQAIGNPRCKGTWKKVRRVDHCSCPDVHSFIFI